VVFMYIILSERHLQLLHQGDWKVLEFLKAHLVHHQLVPEPVITADMPGKMNNKTVQKWYGTTNCSGNKYPGNKFVQSIENSPTRSRTEMDHFLDPFVSFEGLFQYHRSSLRISLKLARKADRNAPAKKIV
jgi:hypothetical protein